MTCEGMEVFQSTYRGSILNVPHKYEKSKITCGFFLTSVSFLCVRDSRGVGLTGLFERRETVIRRLGSALRLEYL